MKKRTINLAAIKGAIASPKTPQRLKDGLIRKYGSQLGIDSTSRPSGLAPSKAPKFKSKNPLAKWETPVMHKKVKRCVKKLAKRKGIKSPYGICKASVGGFTKHNPKNVRVGVDFVDPIPQPYEKKFKIKFITSKDIGGSIWEMTFEGSIKNIQRMLKFHYQSLDEAKELHPEVFKHNLEDNKFISIMEDEMSWNAGRLEYKGNNTYLYRGMPGSSIRKDLIMQARGKGYNIKVKPIDISRSADDHFYEIIILNKNPFILDTAAVAAGITIGEIGKKLINKNPKAKFTLGKFAQMIGKNSSKMNQYDMMQYMNWLEQGMPKKFKYRKSFSEIGEDALKKMGLKKNPGAAWHQEKADEAYDLRSKSSRYTTRSHFSGKVAAHMESRDKSKKLGINPAGWSKTKHAFTSKTNARNIGQKLANYYGLQVKSQKDSYTGKWHLYVKKSLMKINPQKKITKIYDTLTKIEAIKGKESLWPEQGFVHKFKDKSKASIYGLSNGDLLVKSQTGKPLWKNFNY